MNSLLSALDAYRRLDLDGWVALYRALPLWGGLICIVVGLLMLFFGGGRLFRLVAAPLGALIALVWAGAVATRFGFADLQKQVTLGSAIVLAALGLAMPAAISFIALGVPAGLLGGQLVGGNDYLLGFLPGFVIGGAAAVLLHRVLAALVSAALGGWVLTIGLCTSLSPFTGVVASLASNGLTILAIAAGFAVLGAVYQLFIRLPPEEREKLKQEKFMAKKAKKERDELEARWSKRQ